VSITPRAVVNRPRRALLRGLVLSNSYIRGRTGESAWPGGGSPLTLGEKRNGFPGQVVGKQRERLALGAG
jgi:hypothetical protein